jgi:hypothetical protein
MPVGLVLIVSPDLATAESFSRALHQFSIAMDYCREVSTAIPLLNRRKFDGMIVDLDLGEEAGKLLDALRTSPSNRTAVTFAISGGMAETAAWRDRAAFIFERPLSGWSIRNTLRPAYGLILRECRRYFRCPISLPITVLRRDLPEVHCNTVDLSEGGMSLSTQVPLRPGEDVHVQFTIPGCTVPVLAESRVCWRKTGHLGLRFVGLSEESRSELQDWLSKKLEERAFEHPGGPARRPARNLGHAGCNNAVVHGIGRS